MKRMKNMRNNLLCVGIIVIVLCSLGCIGEGQESPAEATPESSTTTPPTVSPQPPTATNNTPPTAKFSMHPENPQDTDHVMFHNESTDPDDEPVRFEWYVDGNYDCACTSINEKFSAGEHTVKLVAKDLQGHEDVYERTFYVSQTLITEDPSKLVLRRENVGLRWQLVEETPVDDNGYRTVFELGEKRVTCTVKVYDTQETAKTAFDEISLAKKLPYQSVGNEAAYEKTENSVEVVFRYGNLVCRISTNTDDYNDAMSYCNSLVSKLNQVR